ncbi:hypothetical protein GA0061070_100435 [Kosakonia oryziphila]|uniref:Uncharacterized protein n=1 Tax=Kosakonia oryziphila TaxID=1005667 RepID=A0A1C4AAT1_9ENTR|nr:hypothetical protein GA0061070_100435 [Kosakonia oryziphila]
MQVIKHAFCAIVHVLRSITQSKDIFAVGAINYGSCPMKRNIPQKEY